MHKPTKSQVMIRFKKRCENWWVYVLESAGQRSSFGICHLQFEIPVPILTCWENVSMLFFLPLHELPWAGIRGRNRKCLLELMSIKADTRQNRVKPQSLSAIVFIISPDNALHMPFMFQAPQCSLGVHWEVQSLPHEAKNLYTKMPFVCLFVYNNSSLVIHLYFLEYFLRY